MRDELKKIIRYLIIALVSFGCQVVWYLFLGADLTEIVGKKIQGFAFSLIVIAGIFSGVIAIMAGLLDLAFDWTGQLQRELKKSNILKGLYITLNSRTRNMLKGNYFFIYAIVICSVAGYYLYAKDNPPEVIIAGVTVTIALIGFFWQINAYLMQAQYDKSAFRLTSALDAYNEAYKLLHDNNDRVVWIAAARTLERGTSIASGITEEVHKDVLQAKLDQYRLQFGNILGYNNPEVTASFFYGAPNDIVNIDEAAKHSSDDYNGRPQLKNLAEESLKIIWDFAQFPDGYNDPIPHGKRFSDKEVKNIFNRLPYPGLIEYLKHTRKFISVKGRLSARPNSAEEET
jgi:hypothetical protein